MKRIIALLAILAAIPLVQVVHAAQPVAIVPGLPESRYDISQSSVSLSSFTVLTYGNVSGYRMISVANAFTPLVGGTTIYYTVNGSTYTLTTLGYPIFPQQKEDIESNRAISLLADDGRTAVQIRVKTTRK